MSCFISFPIQLVWLLLIDTREFKIRFYLFFFTPPSLYIQDSYLDSSSFPFGCSLFSFTVEEKSRRRVLFLCKRLIFMSASFDFAAVFRALSKLCSFSSSSTLPSSALCHQNSLCCSPQQSAFSFVPTVSMRLRPKRYY